jgi:hypothetical protein
MRNLHYFSQIFNIKMTVLTVIPSEVEGSGLVSPFGGVYPELAVALNKPKKPISNL